jgi:hypothetical protein
MKFEDLDWKELPKGKSCHGCLFSAMMRSGGVQC